MLERLRLTFEEYWNNLLDLSPRLFTGVVLLLLLIFLGRVISRLIYRRQQSRRGDPIVRNFVSKAIKWFFYLIGVVVALHILGLGGVANSLVAGAGISAIILGFAFKDIAENFLAGFFLAINRPFQMGNIIEIDGFKGTVRSMDLRNTHIRNFEGKDIYLPNSMLIKNVLINYTKDGLLRQDFTLGLDTNTDIGKVRTWILEYFDGQANILKTPPPDIMVMELGEFTVDVLVLFWVDVFQDRSVSPSFLGTTIRSGVISDIKDLLAQRGVNMPSQVLEHKLYDPATPFSVSIKE